MVTEDIIKQARAGDSQAFRKLYEDIQNEMYRMAYYLLQNKEDAEDAVSEAFIDMYKGISKLKKCEAFKTWAIKILSAKCKRKMREYSIKRDEETVDFAEEQCVSKQDVIGQINMRTDIMKAMCVLDEVEQMIVVCTAVAGMSSDEVGVITGLKSATVRTKLRRALDKLKKRLEVGV